MRMMPLPGSPRLAGKVLRSNWSPAPAVNVSLWIHAVGLATLAANPACWREALGALAANHAVLACGMHPRSAILGPNLNRLPAAAGSQAMVALTFDDGPDPHVTPRVLDLLDAHEVKASFFAIGLRARQHGALVREILRRGHSIENHTYRHPLSFACWSPNAMLREIVAAQRAIADTGGQEPGFFRAPAGLRSPLLDPVLAAAGLSLVSWTRRGYDAVCSRPERVARRLLRNLAAGDILTLHDGGRARRSDGGAVALDVLPTLLERLAEAGLRGVSLPQALAAARGAGAEPAAAAAYRPSAACAST